MKIKVDKKTELELLNESHEEELFMLTDRNRKYLRKWLEWVDYTNLPEDTGNFIRNSEKRYEKSDGLQFVIKYKGKIAGMLGLVEISKFWNCSEIGYWLAEEFTGKGIMTKSCSALINYCFKGLNLGSIIIRCDVRNKPSRGVPKRLGFFKQGILKRDGISRGKDIDHVQYLLRNSEWKN